MRVLWYPGLRGKEGTHIKCSVVQHAVLSPRRVWRVSSEKRWSTGEGTRLSVSEGCTHNRVEPEGLVKPSSMEEKVAVAWHGGVRAQAGKDG